MPGEPVFKSCYRTTVLSDAEIAFIVRSVAVNGYAGPFDFIDSTSECVLAAGHDGDCAGWVATMKNRPDSAWLRWGGDGRRLDWLGGCPADCSLYAGHPGACTPELYPEVDGP